MKNTGSCSHCLVLLTILFLITACQAASSPAQPEASVTAGRPPPTAFVRHVAVEPTDLRQTIRHVGSGDFIHRFGGVNQSTDPISKMNLETFQTKFARVSMDLFSWEPVNDNADPGSMNFDSFKDAGYNQPTFQFMKEMYAKGVEITASIWVVPDWMVEDSTVTTGQIIPPSLYPEAVESIAAWLLHAKDKYGVEVAYVSFNEANIGINILLTPQDVIALLKIAGPRFAELGLNTRWLLGDCSNIGECLAYVEPIWAEQSIRPYLGLLAYHSWDVLNLSDGAIAALGDFALQNGLEARCTETGWDSQLWQRPQELSGWVHARRIAAAYSRVLKLGRAEVLYYWQMMGHDYNLNDGSQPYPAMVILRQINSYFSPGSQIVGTSPNAPSFSSVAAITPSGLAILLVNESMQENVRLTGLPDGTYTQISNTQEALEQTLPDVQVTGGAAEFTMAAFSVYFLIQK